MTDFTDESVKALLDGATPGAWAVNPKAATNVEAGRRGVAACGGYFDNTSDGAYAVENEANAHLIAAAPDLARALLDARAELAQARAEAQAAVALMVERAVAQCTEHDDISHNDFGDGWRMCASSIASAIRALAPADGLAAVKALRVEARENAMQALASMGQAHEAYEAQLEAEAELAAAQQRERVLREALKRLLPAARHYGGLTDDHAKSIEHAEATIRDSQIVATDPGDGWTWNERLGWIGPDGKPADPRRRG